MPMKGPTNNSQQHAPDMPVTRQVPLLTLRRSTCMLHDEPLPVSHSCSAACGCPAATEIRKSAAERAKHSCILMGSALLVFAGMDSSFEGKKRRHAPAALPVSTDDLIKLPWQHRGACRRRRPPDSLLIRGRGSHFSTAFVHVFSSAKFSSLELSFAFALFSSRKRSSGARAPRRTAPSGYSANLGV
jgi:hypothetical protein